MTTHLLIFNRATSTMFPHYSANGCRKEDFPLTTMGLISWMESHWHLPPIPIDPGVHSNRLCWRYLTAPEILRIHRSVSIFSEAIGGRIIFTHVRSLKLLLGISLHFTPRLSQFHGSHLPLHSGLSFQWMLIWTPLYCSLPLPLFLPFFILLYFTLYGIPEYSHKWQMMLCPFLTKINSP